MLKNPSLSIIICGNNKPYKYVQPIKDYKLITGENKKYFLGDWPCIYTELDGSQHTAQLKDIVFADLNEATAKIGNTYKVPVNYIEF